MHKHYIKWAFAVALIIVAVIYGWISYFDIEVGKTLLSKTTGTSLHDWSVVASKLTEDAEWSEIKQRTKPKDNEIHEKWIVVTSVFEPTVQVKKLSKISGWKLIVVADKKTPVNWKDVYVSKCVETTGHETSKSLNDISLQALSQKVEWTKIKRRPQPKSSRIHDKWIIVTTVSLPTQQVKDLSTIKAWKLVVVADKKTPKDWNYPNVVFLSVEKQKQLGYRTTELLPFKSYSRKTIGYLYAIEHGAKIIYETDDDNYPYNGNIGFNPEPLGDFLVYASNSTAINPYEHFGQSTIWPRGYPLENIGDPAQHTFVKCGEVRALIQQGVVNGDPDVDAVFRLTRKDNGVKLDVEFDSKAPPVLLPPGSYAPFNSQNTLFLYDAFWGLMMPPGPAMRVTDIWRAYYDKRLLEEIDGYLAFFGPNAYQERNSHSYLDDFIDEKALYHDAGRFIAFLRQWKPTKTDFFDRIMELTLACVEEKFLEPIDALVMKAWLSDLISIRYKVPELRSRKSPCKKVLEPAKVIKFEQKPSSYNHLGKNLKNIL